MKAPRCQIWHATYYRAVDDGAHAAVIPNSPSLLAFTIAEAEIEFIYEPHDMRGFVITLERPWPNRPGVRRVYVRKTFREARMLARRLLR